MCNEELESLFEKSLLLVSKLNVSLQESDLNLLKEPSGKLKTVDFIFFLGKFGNSSMWDPEKPGKYLDRIVPKK